MTVKEYFSQVYHLERRITQLKLRSEEFERLSQSVSSPNYGGIRTDGTKSFEAPFVKWIEKKDEVDRKIQTLEEKVANLKVEILVTIESLENEDYKNILIMRYLDTLTWEEIASKMFYSLATIKRWHNKALELVKVKSM